MTETPLTPEIADRVVSALENDPNAFVVGGQAINFWARRYGIDKLLTDGGPMMSKDIDFYGGVRSAARLSGLLGGKLYRPGPDDHTPNSAVVEAKINSEQVQIDFLDHVSGVSDEEIGKRVIEVAMPSFDGSRSITITLMHPLHCLQSRVANYYRHGRRDPVALLQVDAAPLILAEFIDEMLNANDLAEVNATLAGLFHWLRSDEFGRKAHMICRPDPLEILRRLSAEPRLDSRFRKKTLVSRVAQIESRRKKRDPPPSDG